MTPLTLTIILFNLFLALIIGIFSYLLHHETHKVAQQLNVSLPHRVARFLRICMILPLFVFFGILSLFLLHLFLI